MRALRAQALSREREKMAAFVQVPSIVVENYRMEHGEGFGVSLLSGNPSLARRLNLPNPSKWMDIMNGSLACRMLSWEL